MKILIVSQYFWPENFKVNDLAKGLVESGHQVSILTALPNYPQGRFFSGFNYWGPFKQIHPDGYPIYRCPILPRFSGKGIQLALNYLSFVFFGSLWALFLASKSFDKILVYEVSPITVAFPAIVIKKLKGIPIFFWVTDLWPESLEAVGAVRNKTVLKLIGQMVHYIYTQCDYILMASRGFKDSIKKFSIPDHRLLYFPQWAEEYYQPIYENPNLPQFKGHERYLKLIFAGNIGEAQSIETLIKAALLLKNNTTIHWYILGDGRRRNWAMKEVERVGIQDNFHFLGSFSPDKMSFFFYYADALIVSLKKELIFELTVPAKIQSYLACAKPILASLDGEGAQIINESASGFSSPAENAELLAMNVLKIMADKQSAALDAIGKRGHSYYLKNFSRQFLHKQLNSWLEEK